MSEDKLLLLKKDGFIHLSESYSKALELIEKRQSGEVKSLKTPWAKINKILMNGFEWNSFVVIGGRPGSGKTLMSSIITREAFRLNPDQDIAVLDFQFEMSHYITALREISGNTRVKMRKLMSGNDEDEKATKEEMVAAAMYCEANKHRDIYTYDKALSPKELVKKIKDFYNIVKKKTIITIDHSNLLLKGEAGNKMDMLYDLGAELAKLRRDYPVIIIVLTQLNREIATKERTVDGTDANLLRDTDVFGADALLQFTDLLIGINKPSQYHIKEYGEDRYLIDDDTLAIHFLKNRNGEPCYTFFKADFPRFSMEETVIQRAESTPKFRKKY